MMPMNKNWMVRGDLTGDLHREELAGAMDGELDGVVDGELRGGVRRKPHVREDQARHQSSKGSRDG
jgi:hypothetical protein